MKLKQHTVLSLVTTANIKKETRLPPIQLPQSLHGHGKFVVGITPRMSFVVILDFDGIFSGLEHRGKLDGNPDLQAFAQTVERVSSPFRRNVQS